MKECKQLKIRILITSKIVIPPSSVASSFCIVSTHSVYKSERHIIPGLGPRRPYIAGESGREKQFSSLYTTASWPAAAASEDTFDRIHFRPGTRGSIPDCRTLRLLAIQIQEWFRYLFVPISVGEAKVALCRQLLGGTLNPGPVPERWCKREIVDVNTNSNERALHQIELLMMSRNALSTNRMSLKC